MKIHEFYIKRAIQLAKNGLGNTYPNPVVGCVIVANGKIIGEGYTSPAGQNHAEVNAIQSVKDKALLKKATLYVTLEPCSHYGKTPPCADLIIENKIPKVVIGTLDTHEKVCGRGVKKLMEAGVDVTIGTLETECRNVNKRFFAFQEKGRPYIILKWAQTDNGYISPVQKETARKPVWISNEISQQMVHQWRTEEHAILVGTQTVLKDNPKLNARNWKGNNPIRVVIDASLRTPKDSHVWDDSIRTIFIISKNTAVPKGKYANIIFEQIDFQNPIAKQIVQVLHTHQIQSVIVEGGAQTLQTFIDESLWDEARVFAGQVQFQKGTPAPVLKNHRITNQENIEGDLLKIYCHD